MVIAGQSSFPALGDIDQVKIGDSPKVDREGDPIPFFWSDQYDVKYQWAGYAPVWDSVDVEGDAHDEFSARYLLAGRLVGVFVANRPKEFGQLRRELVEACTSVDDREVVAQ